MNARGEYQQQRHGGKEAGGMDECVGLEVASGLGELGREGDGDERGTDDGGTARMGGGVSRALGG